MHGGRMGSVNDADVMVGTIASSVIEGERLTHFCLPFENGSYCGGPDNGRFVMKPAGEITCLACLAELIRVIETVASENGFEKLRFNDLLILRDMCEEGGTFSYELQALLGVVEKHQLWEVLG